MIVVVTPEYNRSFPASLKAAIDWHYTEWAAKPIGFVGYSGGSGGILPVEQLRQVFGELQAHTVRDYVSFPRYYQLFSADGSLKDPAVPSGDAKVLLHVCAHTAHACSHPGGLGRTPVAPATP